MGDKNGKLIQYVVVCHGDDIYPELLCDNRAHARYVRKFDKETGHKSYIERREYQSINTKKVS